MQRGKYKAPSLYALEAYPTAWKPEASILTAEVGSLLVNWILYSFKRVPSVMDIHTSLAR